MENNDSSSGVNTVLIVIVLLLIVGFGVWWFTMRNKVAAPDTSGIKIDVNLPSGGDTTPAPTQ